MKPRTKKHPTNDIDWESFFGTIAYHDLRKLSPQLNQNRHPSSYNKTKSHFYISTLDDFTSTNSVSELQSALRQIIESKKLALMSPEIDHYKFGLLKIDYYEICRILSAITPDAERYLDPDEMFATDQSE